VADKIAAGISLSRRQNAGQTQNSALFQSEDSNPGGTGTPIPQTEFDPEAES
jgi:hypothetical protein